MTNESLARQNPFRNENLPPFWATREGKELAILMMDRIDTIKKCAQAEPVYFSSADFNQNLAGGKTRNDKLPTTAKWWRLDFLQVGVNNSIGTTPAYLDLTAYVVYGAFSNTFFTFATEPIAAGQIGVFCYSGGHTQTLGVSKQCPTLGVFAKGGADLKWVASGDAVAAISFNSLWTPVGVEV